MFRIQIPIRSGPLAGRTELWRKSVPGLSQLPDLVNIQKAIEDGDLFTEKLTNQWVHQLIAILSIEHCDFYGD